MGILFNKRYNNELFNLPKHIGIIMDGNGRWAQKRKLLRSFGHKAGAETFRKITKHCSNIGIKVLTVFAFSTENWNRPIGEVNALMALFNQYLKEALTDFKDENIKVKFLGEKNKFSVDIQRLIEEVENSSSKNDGMTLNVAMNYGGRSEIVRAVKKIAQNIIAGNMDVSDINEDVFSNFLYTENQPDPDLIIRTSGEFRTSNFLIWQAAYSEYIVTDVLWPDFKEKDLDNILEIYSKRDRRFGGV